MPGLAPGIFISASVFNNASNLRLSFVKRPGQFRLIKKTTKEDYDMAWERVGAALSLPFAGVHIVEATKQVYRAIPAGRERTRLIPSLEPVLVPSSTASRDKA